MYKVVIMQIQTRTNWSSYMILRYIYYLVFDVYQNIGYMNQITNDLYVVKGNSILLGGVMKIRYRAT